MIISPQSETIIAPQEGKQELFLSCNADIVLYGGGAGGGKTYGCLMKPLYYTFGYPGFKAVFFRRTYTEIESAGGVWDSSKGVYGMLAKANKDRMTWTFPSGAEVRFAHMQHEADKERYASSQIPMIIFEECQLFLRSQFMFMLSRNRSACGVKSQILMTCNPPEDQDHWLMELVKWYLDDEGYPIEERCGKVRYFIVQDDTFVWADTHEELCETYGKEVLPKSFCFINSTVLDNKVLLNLDKDYLGSLSALSSNDKKRLLKGCWRTSRTAGGYFKPEWFEVVPAPPASVTTVRYWDRGATAPSPSSPNPDYTAGCKIGYDKVSGIYYVMDVRRDRLTPDGVKKLIRNTASQDSRATQIVLEEEGGSSGKVDIQAQISNLAGYDARAQRPMVNKEARAKPFSAQCEAGNVKIVQGDWNKVFLDELKAFPSKDYHDDQVDAATGAFNALTGFSVTARTSSVRIARW